MRCPIEIKEKAVLLRQKGYSLYEITVKLGISKSTASLWLRNIKLSQKAQERLKKRGILGQYKSILVKKKKRKEFLDNLRKIARVELNSISKSKETYRLLCAILFWCEGNKSQLSHVRFTNSDPTMVKCFLYFLRKGFLVDEGKFRGLIHVHGYHNKAQQINFWSEVTGIPKTQFNKSYEKPNTSKRIRKNYPGCIAVSYYDAKLAKMLWAYYKEVQNIFLRPVR